MLRVAFIGAGWIVPFHLRALGRLGRAEVVGFCTPSAVGAARAAAIWGGRAFKDAAEMLDREQPDAVVVAVPPVKAPIVGHLLVERRIPFLIEKPLAAADADAPVRLAKAIEAHHLVVGVGYQLRGLDHLGTVREALANRPPHLVTGRWMGPTPAAPWWRRTAEGGGQVVEQATHLFDLARVLVGEATVVAAASIRTTRDPAIDVADATSAVLRFEAGAIGAFSCSRLAPGASGSIGLEIVADGLRVTIGPQPDIEPGWWPAVIDGEEGRRVVPVQRDPYETQMAAFLDAVEAGDPGLVLCRYEDALRTDRLTRAVVAATGAPG